MPSLILNADDFAIHPAINEGIVEAYTKGVLTSTTLLLTTPFLNESIQHIKSCGIPTGIHLTINLGRPRAAVGDLPHLVNKDGFLFRTPMSLLALLLKNRKSLMVQIRRELESQLQLSKDLGFSPTHFDFHQHLQLLPFVMEVLQELAKKYGYNKWRWVNEPWQFPLNPLSYKSFVRLVGLKLLAPRGRPDGLVPDQFLGIMDSGRVTKKRLKNLIDRIPSGVTEVALHPGHIAPLGQWYPQKSFNRFVSSPWRRKELDALLDPNLRKLIESKNIRLMSYGDL
jgi:predicted glycoside hydrolase/deacetylase ChbG (UPF0249 family)